MKSSHPEQVCSGIEYLARTFFRTFMRAKTNQIVKIQSTNEALSGLLAEMTERRAMYANVRYKTTQNVTFFAPGSCSINPNQSNPILCMICPNASVLQQNAHHTLGWHGPSLQQSQMSSFQCPVGTLTCETPAGTTVRREWNKEHLSFHDSSLGHCTLIVLVLLAWPTSTSNSYASGSVLGARI